MSSKAIILTCIIALAYCAPKELDDGEVVAVALEKYAEYMVVPENQEKLWYKAKAEELGEALETKSDLREVEEDQTSLSEEQNKDSIFDSLLGEMGSAKNIIAGFPIILEAIAECKSIVEEEEDDSIRKKRDVIEWLQNAYGKFKDKTSEVRTFFKSDVKDFITNNVTKFFTEDVSGFLTEDVVEFFKEDVVEFFKKDVKDFFSNDVKNFFVENYEKAKELLGLSSEEGKSTFKERMDDFLSTTRKGLKKAGSFGYCIVSKNLQNPLLRSIVDIFT